MTGDAKRVIYGVDDRPRPFEAVSLGIQHLLAMLLGNITPPLLVAGALGLATGQTAFLVQMALVVAGVATIVQSYPIGPVGARLPIVMGTSIAFVGGVIAIGREHSLATVFGACLVAGLVEVFIGHSITRLRWLFPPLVTGTVVMLIGLTLIPVGVDYSAGGIGADDYGSPANLGIATLVFVVTLLVNRLARGFLSAASLLIGVSAGFLVALAVGMVDTSGISDAGWVEVPRPLVLGLEFDLGAVFVMAAIYVVSAMETLGDIAGTVAAVGREPTSRELSGGLVADGVMSSIAALFGAFPNTSYSQNVGLVNFSGVVSRHVTAVTGGLMIALGLVPKVGALFATVPAPVIGGGAVIMFSMIFASGALIIHRGVELDQRNLVIMAVSVGLGLGVELRPDALAALPQGVRAFLGSGLITGGLTALALNVAFPGRHRKSE